jgi:hypothetical protein
MLTGDLPKGFLREMVSITLCDNGSRVRSKAAGVCGHLRLSDMLPEMECRLKVERNKAVRDSLEFFIAMLRDGYLLKYRGRQPVLWVRTPESYCAPAITQEDIDNGKLQAIIAETSKGDF